MVFSDQFLLSKMSHNHKHLKLEGVIFCVRLFQQGQNPLTLKANSVLNKL